MKYITPFDAAEKLDESSQKMMPIARYYKKSGAKIQKVAKEIDGLIEDAKFKTIEDKYRLLDLITDLVDVHLEDVKK
jgi:hypothetical protein